MVENFGSYLKHERELRGVPLEEISGATKIHIRYLIALEENSFDQLPGEVFIKGYIRSYANTIGSDVEEMLNIYKESVELKNQQDIPQESSSKTKPKTLIVLSLLFLAVAGLLFGVGYQMKKEGPLEKPKEQNIPSVSNQVEIPKEETILNSRAEFSEEMPLEDIAGIQQIISPKIQTPEEEPTFAIVPLDKPIEAESEVDNNIQPAPQESVELVTESKSNTVPEAIIPNTIDIEKPLKLSIKANEISWFNMTIDDFREEDFILPAGTAKTFWGNEMFRLTVGNKSGVELILNGANLTLPESKDKVVKDFIINSKLIE